MKIIRYLKEHGIKRLFIVLYEYKMDLFIQKIILSFVRNKPLKNIIIIESHNDFDSNGGALYKYLIKKGFNNKYKIVWLLKNKIPKKLPDNVEAYSLFRPNFRKDYFICVAKILSADCCVTNKVRDNQKSFYLSHGAFSLKSSHGKIDIPESVDYVLIPSEYTLPIQEKQYNPSAKTKLISIGFPVHDIFFSSVSDEIKKLTEKQFKKTIIWMPTFRKGGGFHRNDSEIELPLGIPLIEDEEQYTLLDQFARNLDILLIIKIHPMQDMSTVKISDKSNIKVLTGDSVKTLNIDNYSLLKDTDALISDYSSIAYDYLMLDRPIAYVFSDLKTYKNGLVTDCPDELMAGPIIENYYDLENFILDIVTDRDLYKEKRQLLRGKIFKYCDGNSAHRLVDFMKL
ncbi:teichoic acid biosynthesis protein TagF [Clostridium autoethanogenum]|uniref:Teichoic acid biosynthesis protein TagF n=1 Tax=Clostridium autoethanogenum TaxID=84023 RepID=A0A3M0SCD9_9CLOT|nr:CDP-glycerol glycerophosphotransferase family protein [Clostridium autoethanogenum]RMC92307.1 teichoic acid biosynthesis protein TagF [Clostridium autoethanogenum]